MDEDCTFPISPQQERDLKLMVRQIERRGRITYKKLNSLVLAKPPHYGRPRALPYIMEDVDTYPIASTTNQRRRPWCLNGHRGVGPTSVEIRRKDTWKLVDGNMVKELGPPVGIWRGLDPRLIKGYNEKYNGANLRKIRAVKGVGRPCVLP